MDKARSLYRGGAWLVAANALENLGLLLLNLAVIKAFGAGPHGRFVLFVAVVSVLRLAADAGISPALVRLLGGGAGRGILLRAASLTAALALPPALLVAWRPGLFTDAETHGFAFFGLWLLALTAHTFASAAFNGRQAMHLTFASTALLEAAKLGSAAWLLLAGPSFGGFLRTVNLALLAAALSIALLLFLHARGWNGPRPEPPPGAVPAWRGWRGLARLSLVLWLPHSAAPILAQLMPLVIGLGLADSDVSFYNILSSWSLLAAVLLTPLSNAFFAWTARHGSAPDAAAIRDGFFRLAGAASLAIAMLLMAAAGPLLRAYGPEYPGLRPLFLLFVLAQLSEYPRHVTAPLLNAGGRPEASLALEAGRMAAALLAVAGVLFLSPSLWAVACALLAVQALAGPIRLLHARHRLGFPALGAYLRVQAAGAGAFLIIFRDLHPALAAVLLAAAFAWLGGVRPSDCRRALRALRGSEGDVA